MIDSYEETFNNKPVKIYEIGDAIDTQFCYKVESEYDAEVSVIQKLTDLSTRELSNQLEELIIGAWQESFEVDPSDILTFLIENKTSFTNLKHIFVGDMTSEDCEISWIQQTTYETFFSTYPALETFKVRGGEGLSLGKFELPNLKALIIETGGLNDKIVTELTASKATLNNLEHLELWLGEENYGAMVKPEHLTALLAQPFSKLNYLGLKNSDLQNDVAILLKNHPILDQIEILDLSMGTLTDVGANALLENESLLKLKHLNCRHHFIPDDLIVKLKAKFSAQNINLDDQEDIEDDWLYVEVGE